MGFEKYKPRLKELLRHYSVDDSINPTHCFNPTGHSHGDANPSLQLWDDGFKCYGCGIQGDIYDAVGILEGITDKKEQYKFVEKFFGEAYTPPPALPKPSTEEEKDFEPDKKQMEVLEAYLRKNPASEKEIKRFLADRANYSTGGAVKMYPEDLVPFFLEKFFYWPGLDIALKDLSRDVLKDCGIPLVNPKTQRSTWEHSGVVMRLGMGYKLHYYEKRYCDKCKEAKECRKYKKGGFCWKCEKRTSKSGKTFPMPGEINTALPVILVEGEMDALACAASGIKNLFAAGGTNGLTGPKVKKWLLGVPEIILCFDAEIKGRKASGLEPLEPGDGRKSNIPQIIRRAGYNGKIRLAELPPETETGCKDQDALVLAGKRGVIERAIQEAKEYTLPAETEKELKGAGTIWEAYDSISVERLRDLLKRIPREVLDTEDIQPFISACVMACKHSATKQELAKWGAISEELNVKNDTSPYFLIEVCEKYGVSRYLKKEIEKSLVPESEILKVIKNNDVNIEIDFEKVKNLQSVKQFIATGGVHSAAQVVCDILDGNVVFIKEEGEFYFFDGHIWNYESNMEGIVYNILCSILSYYLKNKLKEKGYLWDMIVKIDGWRFRVETVQDFSGFHGIHITEASFDGPGIKETLTLSDGVMDFSGSEIIYRKSIREEFRRYCLPYSVEDVKNSGTHARFDAFMKQNFKNEKTLDTLMYYLSLIPSRNTQFKYGGVFIGKRHTGKTTTIEVMRKIYPTMLGNIPPDILVTRGRRNNTGNEATPYIAALEGKGAGIASETEKGAVLNNALFKLLTGGDTLIARGLYKAPRSFTPTAQIIIATNHSPRFDAQDSATIDRMVIIPFSVTHERGGEDTKSQDVIINSLRSEFPAVVKMLAEYYIKLRSEYDGAIPFSEECLNYKNNYVDEQRTDLDKFVSDNIEFGLSGEHFEKVEDLYNRFLLYYDISEEDAEKEALPRKKFTFLLRRDFLEMKNYKKKKFGNKALPCFFNIKLKPWDEDTERPVSQGYFENEAGNGFKKKNDGAKAGTQAELPEEENPF